LKLLVGLGNPGPEYGRTRHNVGYLVADEVARRVGVSFDLCKFAAEIAETRAGRERVWIMKPQTYMNGSGESVGPALRYWKLDLEDLVVVHDDLELEPFRVQVKVGGGHGGNNGVKSVNAHLGSHEYARVRVGIGRPPPEMDPADYVLGRFRKDQETMVRECVEWAADAAWAVVLEGAVKAMNQVNRRKAES
jgi:peptidyl-tRNA hydrolase, PTH1 family